MPLFEYVCIQTPCQKKVERIHSANVENRIQCPSCHSTMSKMFPTPASIRLGTGTTRRDSGMNRKEM